MIEALDIMKQEDAAISRRQSGNGSFDGKTIYDAGLCKVAGLKTACWTVLRKVTRDVVERYDIQHPLAQMHQRCVHGQPV